MGSVVTDAHLTPTDPLPAEENYCDECRLCLSACASGLMHQDEKATVTLGGIEFSYARRQSYNRCDYVCGGFTGLSKSGKWSTWSPARFPVPETDEEFLDAIRNATKPYAFRPKPGVGFYHALLPGKKGQMTCGHCQLICHPDKDIRKIYAKLDGSKRFRQALAEPEFKERIGRKTVNNPAQYIAKCHYTKDSRRKGSEFARKAIRRCGFNLNK